MTDIDRTKLNKIVGFIRARGCWFDPGDATEDLCAVLGDYGLAEILTVDEMAELVPELESLAEEHQAGEIALQVSIGEETPETWTRRLRYME